MTVEEFVGRLEAYFSLPKKPSQAELSELQIDRRKCLGILQREVAREHGIRVETVSATEMERAKYFEERSAYKALPDKLENPMNTD